MGLTRNAKQPETGRSPTSRPLAHSGLGHGGGTDPRGGRPQPIMGTPSPASGHLGPIQRMDGPGGLKQTLITDYFGNPNQQGAQAQPGGGPLVFAPEEVVIDGDDGEYTARVEGLGQLGELSLLEEEGVQWINYIEVHAGARRRGIGTRLLQRAIDEYGKLYASTQPADMDNGGDTRHLTDEGDALVSRCIDRGMNIEKAYPCFVHADVEDNDEMEDEET